MVLQVLPLQLSDFEDLISHATLHDPGDDLVGPPTPICWPPSTPAAALSRATFHFAKQRSRFLGDPTVRYMKVVDTGTVASPKNSIISIARWHFYPQGYNFATQLHWELHALTPPPPSELNVSLHNYILSTRDEARSGWMEPNEPCWILMHMVTRESQRGRGAAKMLIRWGIEQAERDGVPAYLEAGVMGRPVYEKLGFKQVGELLEVDLRRHGIQSTFVMCKMAYFPAGYKTKDQLRDVTG
ncbi:hypothetical protein N7510_007986 [Penicillium lagena]|uniref:uncharacterized protein n=1 Tax=Penicillium lagena TaxID=94218 RepID=UPI0025404F56|nr:uncharacterized protein N7510_007986 [Penicillium lagena]KAJ5611267.1 hypothetical protein N7510_007986 [Penicillium lagena]